MQWSELYDSEHKPSDIQITEFADTPLWNDLTTHLQQTYHVEPKLFYSCCTMQEGFWEGWFAALINVGAKELVEADLLMPFCDVYTQDLYKQTKSGRFGKSLAVEVTNHTILRDAKNLIALRINSC